MYHLSLELRLVTLSFPFIVLSLSEKTLVRCDLCEASHLIVTSPNRIKSAKILFCLGKGYNGYFSNDDTSHHVEKTMNILEKHYSNEDHVFIFDNVSTHMKQPNDSLSA